LLFLIVTEIGKKMSKRHRIDVGRDTCVTRVFGFTTFMLVLTFFLTLFVVAGGCGGCGKKSKEKAKTEGAEQATLKIKGSDTMLPMITALAEAYTKLHPDTQISVAGGGSTVGISALIDGAVDLCMSSRAVNAGETQRADYRRIALQDVIVALDGVAVIVHSQNPANELTMSQLRQIFNGGIKNWREVGGPNQAIRLVSRDSDSGTSAFFQERVLQKDDYGPGVQLVTSSGAVVQSVSREFWSIGYVGLAYVQGAGVKVIGVKKNSGSVAVLPLYATVLDGSYLLERPLHIYASNKVSSLALSFLEFVFSPEGQRITKEKGYVST
jgi:phosphate transport system substrate-binding protein